MKHESDLREARDTHVLGHRMIDDRGSFVGWVNDVLSVDPPDEAAWAVVGTRWFGTERFVPLDEAYVAIDGNVVVPYDKNTIKHAPRAGDHVLVRAVREALAAYYGR